MGVKATLAGVTLTAGDITQAKTLEIDAKGLMAVAQAKCDDRRGAVVVWFAIRDSVSNASDLAVSRPSCIVVGWHFGVRRLIV